MKDRLTAVGFGKQTGRWIVLLASTLGLSGISQASEACPPDAVAPGVQISVAAYRQNGLTTVGSGTVVVGETIVLRSCIFHVPVDASTLATLSSVEQGNLTISFNGSTSDVTPVDGIPLVGPSCQGLVMVPSSNLTYVVTAADAAAGTILVRADYTGGIPHLPLPVPVHVTAHVLVRVAQSQTAPVAGRLAIQKNANGSALLSFTGQLEKTYRVEASSDLAQWVSLGSVTPNQVGQCQIEDTDAGLHAYRFYRYAVEN